MKCKSCDNDATFTTKLIYLCDECFFKRINKKIRKGLNYLKENKYILLLNNSKNSMVLLDFLSQIVNYDDRNEFYILDENHKDINNFVLSNKFQFIQKPSKWTDNFKNYDKIFIENLCHLVEESKIKNIIMDENLDNIAANIFTMILKGDGGLSKEYAMNEFKYFTILKPLKEISAEEIKFYLKLNNKNIQLQIENSNNDPIKDETEDFIKSLSQSNPSTMKNIIGIFKKM